MLQDVEANWQTVMSSTAPLLPPAGAIPLRADPFQRRNGLVGVSLQASYLAAHDKE
jgi:hypothetical protein